MDTYSPPEIISLAAIAIALIGTIAQVVVVQHKAGRGILFFFLILCLASSSFFYFRGVRTSEEVRRTQLVAQVRRDAERDLRDERIAFEAAVEEARRRIAADERRNQAAESVATQEEIQRIAYERAQRELNLEEEVRKARQRIEQGRRIAAEAAANARTEHAARRLVGSWRIITVDGVPFPGEGIEQFTPEGQLVESFKNIRGFWAGFAAGMASGRKQLRYRVTTDSTVTVSWVRFGRNMSASATFRFGEDDSMTWIERANGKTIVSVYRRCSDTCANLSD